MQMSNTNNRRSGNKAVGEYKRVEHIPTEEENR